MSDLFSLQPVCYTSSIPVFSFQLIAISILCIFIPSSYVCVMRFFTPLPSSSVAYIGPGVTSYQGLNMGFRIYTMDGIYNGTTYVHTEFLPLCSVHN